MRFQITASEVVQVQLLVPQVAQMVQPEPERRLAAEEYLKQQRGKAFPDIFYTFLQPYMAQFAKETFQSADERVLIIRKDLDNILHNLRGETCSPAACCACSLTRTDVIPLRVLLFVPGLQGGAGPHRARLRHHLLPADAALLRLQAGRFGAHPPPGAAARRGDPAGPHHALPAALLQRPGAARTCPGGENSGQSPGFGEGGAEERREHLPRIHPAGNRPPRPGRRHHCQAGLCRSAAGGK